MVFVHSRKDTVKSAESMKELATLEGELDIFSCQEDPQYEFYRREIARSKNKEMKQLFDSGFGIHHAGMLRADRNLMERLFEAKVIKVGGWIFPDGNSQIRVGSVLHGYTCLGGQSTGTWSRHQGDATLRPESR
jgi:hypothetical protein